MDTELQKLLAELKQQVLTTGKVEVEALAAYFLTKKDYAVLVPAMAEMTGDQLVDVGVNLGEAWKAGNAASTAATSQMTNIGWAIFIKALEIGLTSMGGV